LQLSVALQQGVPLMAQVPLCAIQDCATRVCNTFLWAGAYVMCGVSAATDGVFADIGA
jgi:hypothetical protein